jgi:hypothetical protein
LLAQERASDRSLVTRGCEFRDVDKGLTRNCVGAALAGLVGKLTIVAMMPFCTCFARRVKPIFGIREIILRKSRL